MPETYSKGVLLPEKKKKVKVVPKPGGLDYDVKKAVEKRKKKRRKALDEAGDY